MANKSTHAGVGALAGLGTYALVKWLKKEPWTLAGAMGSTAAGAAIACVPDIIEPALHPNHRGPSHSIAALSGILYAIKKVWESPNMNPESKSMYLVALASYASHLVLDVNTPKGLPLVGV